MSARRAAGRVLLALLMVSSVVVGTTGQAAAASSEDPCHGAVQHMYQTTSGCLDPGSKDYSNLSEIDSYAAGIGISYRSDAYLAQTNNLQQDARQIAWNKAYIEMVTALNNGRTEANATEQARQAAADYLAGRQLNIVNRHNQIFEELRYWNDTSNSAFGLTVFGSSADNKEQDDIANIGTNTADSPTLVNGSQTTQYTLISPDGQNGIWTLNPWRQYQRGHVDNPGHISVTRPGTTNQTIVFNSSKWSLAAYQYEEIYNQIDTNINTTVSQLYANYGQGDITAEDLAQSNPTAIASEAGTSYNDTGYYSYANTQAAALGLSGNTNASHIVMTTLTNRTVQNGSVVWDNRTVEVEGTLFYTADDGQTFATGQTYDPDNLQGSVYLTVSSMVYNDTGQSVGYGNGFYYVNKPFTVESATNVRTGEPVENTTMQTRTYEYTNVTGYSQEIDRLKAQRDYYEQLVASQQSTGGSSGTDDGQQQQAGLLAGLRDYLNTLGIGIGLGSTALAAAGLWLLGRVLG